MTSERPALEDFGLNTNELLADQVRGLMGRLMEAEHEIERLRADLTKHDCLVAQLIEDKDCLPEMASEIERLRAALKELHAVVWGECPSLLNEDSGGDASLDLRIRELIDQPADA